MQPCKAEVVAPLARTRICFKAQPSEAFNGAAEEDVKRQ